MMGFRKTVGSIILTGLAGITGLAGLVGCDNGNNGAKNQYTKRAYSPYVK